MARPRIFFLLLALLASLTSASAPTFCKCTCFKNSTIIPLGPSHGTAPSSPPSPRHDDASVTQPRAASSSCSQCNRAACLSYNLPFCRGAEEKDVVAMCFQRDSRKDQIMVWSFILGTAGLLGWAAVKRVLEARGVGRAAALPGLSVLRGSGNASGGMGPALADGGLQQRRAGGVVGGGRADVAARGAYSPVGTVEDGAPGRGPG